ncbi:MAG: hypothetical protein O7E52_02170, partial [Candidatus Poribacteria bacterium]|nr:hypothetical protein [Candidatus Poribacteria bacterium]
LMSKVSAFADYDGYYRSPPSWSPPQRGGRSVASTLVDDSEGGRLTVVAHFALCLNMSRGFLLLPI